MSLCFSICQSVSPSFCLYVFLPCLAVCLSLALHWMPPCNWIISSELEPRQWRHIIGNRCRRFIRLSDDKNDDNDHWVASLWRRPLRWKYYKWSNDQHFSSNARLWNRRLLITLCDKGLKRQLIRKRSDRMSPSLSVSMSSSLPLSLLPSLLPFLYLPIANSVEIKWEITKANNIRILDFDQRISVLRKQVLLHNAQGWNKNEAYNGGRR